MTLSEFLLAQFDEEHAAAQASYDEATDYRIQGSRLTEDHFALWKPARVLAEVDAKRRIVDQHGRDDEGYCDECGSGRQDWGPGDPADFYPVPWPCPTLRLMGLPYADHPDYDEVWRP